MTLSPKSLAALALFAGLACNFGQSVTPAAAPTEPAPATQSAPPSTPSVPSAQSVATSVATAGYITFAVNVHDTGHVDESADTLLRAIDLFERHGVRGDFYLTGPMVALYAEQRPDVIERLRDSDMTISYHVRAPHPLVTGFGQRLQGLSEADLADTLRDYETYALDPATGDLDRSRPGGYTFVAQTLGRNPVVAPSPGGDERLRRAAATLFYELGARMTVLYHEEGTDPADPFAYAQGLLVRPSDFSVTRWTVAGGKPDTFWWNMLDTPQAADYNPTAYLQARLDAWTVDRPPFVTALIHENNFVRSGPESWTPIYYAGNGKDQPLSPPFDLAAADPSRLRSPEEQEMIWAAYEELVAYAAAHLSVVTSEDIVALAAGQ